MICVDLFITFALMLLAGEIKVGIGLSKATV